MPATAIRPYHDGYAVGDCPFCGCDDALVAPGCPDGHGADCPDRVCIRCGTALFVNPDVHPDLRDDLDVVARRTDRIA